MKKLLLACAVAGFLFAADKADPKQWTSSELKGIGKTIAGKLDGKHVGGQPLAEYGNHRASMSYRDADGEGELHVNVADLFVVQSGEATVVVGGEVVNPKTTAPGEVRGESVKGGERHMLKAGDVLYIPKNTPHQSLVAKGKTFTYFVMKVDAK